MTVSMEHHGLTGVRQALNQVRGVQKHHHVRLDIAEKARPEGRHGHMVMKRVKLRPPPVMFLHGGQPRQGILRQTAQGVIHDAVVFVVTVEDKQNRFGTRNFIGHGKNQIPNPVHPGP